MNKGVAVLLGHFCGDAAGATLEFYTGDIDDRIANEAMRMKGGGRLNMGPGQITDDGELTIALCNTLWNLPKNSYPINDVARAYSKWYRSEPFDCGMTCARAFGGVSDRDYNIGLAMIQHAANVNIVSEANGALMRAAPIAVWGARHQHTLHQIATNARLDAMLSHPSKVCQDCNVIYCITIAKLLETGDVHKAMHDIDDYVSFNIFNPTVLLWYNHAKSMSPTMSEFISLDARINIGHVKHAFTMAMFFVHHGDKISFKDGIREVLKCGGDTDTNAAICGAILGAIHGFDKLPKDMIYPVMGFDCVRWDTHKHLMGHNRPKDYHVGTFMETIFEPKDVKPKDYP